MQIERFVNELMSSNCYLVVDEVLGNCICIDPASEKSEKEITFIDNHNLKLDYIILTHEHTDHTWGVNSLKARYPDVKILCSEVCKHNLKKEFQAYFLLYYDNPDYQYRVCNIDLTAEEIEWKLDWCGHKLEFISTPGHSMGSMCILLEEFLFTGDAILQSKPYVNKRNGSKELLRDSARIIVNKFSGDTKVYPGHGDPFKLNEWVYRSVLE